MTLCFECDRFYFGSYGAHWRFAHHNESRVLRQLADGTYFLGDTEGEGW